MNYRSIQTLLLGVALVSGTCAYGLAAQTATPAQTPARRAPQRGGGTVHGSVKDDTGGVIPGATITLLNPSGTVQTTSSDANGNFTFNGVAPGAYTVTSSFTGLQQQHSVSVTVTGGQPATAAIAMTVQAQKQEVTVSDSVDNTVSTEASNNASQLVLKQADLDALPDDPDDLQADLEALAGPSAGPGGNQIYIDGFTGGRLPPKASIREIRINSNPFSAEFDKMGYGRIQIFTKPGSDKFHGQGSYSISDGVWNSRNPFLTVNPPFRSQQYGGNVSGPLTTKGSFFIDVERRQIDDNGIVTASIPTGDFLSPISYQNFFPTPQRRTTVSPRFDYQLNANNTLSFRYLYLNNDRQVAGIGAFNLPALTIGNIQYPSQGYTTPTTEQGVQLVETAVINTKVVNETHFSFDREYETWSSQSTAPQLMVANSFTSGGSGYSSTQYPNSYDLQNSFELQNYTSVTWGAHTTKFGARIRSDILDDSSPKGFNGTYQFLGTGATNNSLTQYLTTMQLLQSGLSSAKVTAMGYGPSKYTVTGGNPYIGLSQTDAGPFVQDDWKIRPNLTISLGVRYEVQTNVSDYGNLAPRFGFAWSPSSGSGRPKTVIRGGWGMFYDRFAITNVEQALRYAQNSQVSYSIVNPTVYDATFSTPLPITDLNQTTSAQRYQIDSHLVAPRLMQTAIGVERQLLAHTQLTVNFLNSRGTHELLTNDINAPIPVPGQLPPGAQGYTGPLVRPFGNVGDIYDYQSTGTFKQTQVLVNVNSQVGRWMTLFGRYSYNNAHSDTDGLTTIPSNPYNIGQNWGRTQMSYTHSLFLGGSITSKWWGLRFSPFITARSGLPFNVTTGTDLYLTGQGQPTARPSLAEGATINNLHSSYISTPLVGTAILPRNAGIGAGSLGVNLRVSKTWGFGSTKFEGPSGGSRGGGGDRGGGGGGGPRGGPGGGFGGPRGPGGGGDATNHRYNLTLSVNARNILNHENLNTFNGAITSPYFFQATGISGGFGAEATASNQRRIDIQLRFAF
jgi:Carboxypeptidase regulatory-like domain